MKLLISFLLSIFILFSNLSASENTQKLTPKINNEQLQELIKKLQEKILLFKIHRMRIGLKN